MSSDGYLVVTCFDGTDFQKNGRHKLMVEFGKDKKKTHFMNGSTEIEFDSCISFPCERIDFENNPVSICVMNDKSFGRHPKIVAKCEVVGAGNGGHSIWGPTSIVCKHVKKDQEYCKLNVQIQFITYDDIIVHPNIDVSNPPDCKKLILKFNKILLPNDSWYEKGMYMEIYNNYRRIFVSGEITEQECSFMSLLSLEELEDNDNISFVLYYGNDNYIGEGMINVHELVTMDETDHSLAFRMKGCKEAVIEFRSQCLFSSSCIAADVSAVPSMEPIPDSVTPLELAPTFISIAQAGNVPIVMQPVEPSSFVQLMPQMQPVQPMGSMPYSQPMNQGIESIQPMESVQFIQPVQPVQPPPTLEPIQPIQSVEPIQPPPSLESIQPIQPIQSIEPIQPPPSLEPMQPIPLGSAQPMESIPVQQNTQPIEERPPSIHTSPISLSNLTTSANRVSYPTLLPVSCTNSMPNSEPVIVSPMEPIVQPIVVGQSEPATPSIQNSLSSSQVHVLSASQTPLGLSSSQSHVVNSPQVHPGLRRSSHFTGVPTLSNIARTGIRQQRRGVPGLSTRVMNSNNGNVILLNPEALPHAPTNPVKVGNVLVIDDPDVILQEEAM